MDRYWICRECAEARGGFIPNDSVGYTAVGGTCGWCEGANQTTSFLIPIINFKWTNGMPKPEKE